MINENNAQLIDIYDMWYQPFWKTAWFYYSFVIIFSLIFLYFIWVLYKKYRYKKTIVDCSIIALQELDNLKKIHITTLADSKDCYFKISLIIRQYLTARYMIACMQLTDTEIMAQTRCMMTDEQSIALKHIFQAMKFIKFAHEFARNEKLEKDIQAIKEFIDNSSPKPAMKK